MTTYKELVYMVLDELKAKSDDFYYTEDHIIFLLEKYRAFLLKQKYRTPKSVVLNSNYSYIEIPAPLTLTAHILETSFSCEAIPIAQPKLTVIPNRNDTKKEVIFNYCTEDRRLFLRQSNYLKNMNYFYFLNNKLVLDSGNKFFKDNHRLNLIARLKIILESPSKVYKNLDDNADILDMVFPLEESLISPLLEMVVKDLTSAMFKPEDDINNGKDETGDLNKFMYQNSKSDLQKQIYG